MNKIKVFFAPAAVFFLSMIITFAWSAVLKWDDASNFIASLIFWILCIACIVITTALLPMLNIDFPFKVAVVMLNVLYYITFVAIVSFGVFAISGGTYIVIQLVLLFIYLVIAAPIILMSLKQTEGE